jgi:enoyl-CoA hydratase/carnithine racemase
MPSGALMDEARALAAKISRQPPGVLRTTKKLMREALGADLETIMEMSASFQARAHASEDHAEALAAFFEKRDPDFKGR